MADPDFTPHPLDHVLRLLREDALVARFAAARADGDVALQRAAWRALAVRSYPRIRAMARTHDFGSARMPEHQADDAAQEAFLRVVAMGERFEGTAIGQYRKALRTCVHNACMDWGRGELTHERPIAGRLDEPWQDGEGGSRWEGAFRVEHERREAQAREKLEAEDVLARERDVVERAIAGVDNDDHRAVLELTYLQGLSGARIAERLGIEIDNVYQRRLRGKRQMERILRDIER